jgi:hypothetical protein
VTLPIEVWPNSRCDEALALARVAAIAMTNAMTLDPADYARRWKMLGVLSLSLVIIGLDNTIVSVALPTLQNTFHASSSTFAARAIAEQLPPHEASRLFDAIGDAFTHAMGIGFVVSAALVAGAALLVLRFLPAGEQPVPAEARRAEPPLRTVADPDRAT